MPVEAAVRLSSERGVGRRLYSGWRPLPPAQEAATAPVQVGPLPGQFRLCEGSPWVTVGHLCLLVDSVVNSSCRDGAPHHGGARGLHPDARDHDGQLCQQPEEKVSWDNILIVALSFGIKGHLNPFNYECNRCHNCLIYRHTVIVLQ